MPLLAQRPFAGTAETRYAVDRLAHVARVLMIAAHPDDENTALLAYLARGRNVRTGYLSLTRGEGGQNLIGSEQGPLLGVIRTQELLEARSIDGAEQFFTSAVDFGFTKTAEETLRVWDRKRVLGEVVFTIRKFQPDVIILRFSGTPRDGHGQHQASAILGKEAFGLAADPSAYPEQLSAVKPWKAKRLLWNAFAFTPEQQREFENAPNQVKVDVGEYDPLFGYSYAEIAGLSRSRHRSQAMGSPQRKGSSVDRLLHVAGDLATKDLLDGVVDQWSALPGGDKVSAAITRAVEQFSAESPEKTVAPLLEARDAISKMPEFANRERKLNEIDRALIAVSGLWLDASTDRASATPGSSVKVTLSAVNRSALPLELVSADLAGTVVPGEALADNKPWNKDASWKIAPDHKFSQPYWLGKEPAPVELIGAAQNPPEMSAHFKVSFPGNHVIDFEQPVRFRRVDRMYGELTQPFAIVPRVSVSIAESSVIFPDRSARNVAVQVQASEGKASGELALRAPAGWTVEPATQKFTLGRKGEEQQLSFRVNPPAMMAEGDLVAVATVDGKEISSSIVMLSYSHIQTQTLLLPATAKAVRVDVKLLSKNIGYIPGAGDKVPEALAQIGASITMLGPDELAHADLGRFDAIVTGVRAFNVREDLSANKNRLLEYVKNGGTLVVQYNTAERNTALDIGPYPITLSSARVSVEDAPVQILAPGNPLLEVPNPISQTDFNGWIQERGLYFASNWDEHYQPLIESHDPNEPPQKGGLLFTRYGKGAFVFTGYSWFRELPAGVPGAFRIFANLLSAGKTLPATAAAR